MEGKKELSEKYLALKKKIEQKEKKLQKFNRVLEAKDHVKKKLKECNQQEENRESVQSKDPSLDTGRQHKITTNVSSKKSLIKQSLLIQNQILETNSLVETRETAISKLLDNSVTSRIKNTSPVSTIKKDKIHPCYPDDKCDSDFTGFKSYVLQIRKDSRNDHGDDITTCHEREDKWKGSNDIYNTENKEMKLRDIDTNMSYIGQSEESPIVIGDTQPASTSTDNSLNSALGSKKRLSLKRKKKSDSKSKFNLNKKQKNDEGGLDFCLIDHKDEITKPAQTENTSKNTCTTDSNSIPLLSNISYHHSDIKQCNVNHVNGLSSVINSKIKNLNKNQEKENVVNCIETADSSEKRENASQSLLGIQVKNDSEVKLKEGHNVSSQELFEFTQTPISMKQKRLGRSTKLNKEQVESVFELKVIKTKENENPKDNVDEISQETVIECTPDIGLSVDLDKGFVLDTADKAVNNKFSYNIKAAILIDNEESSVKNIILSSSNTQSSSQDSLIGHTQENSQPRRRGRPSKTKRSKQNKTAFSTRFNYSEKNQNSEAKLQTVENEKVKGLMENIEINNEFNVQSSHDTVIECTPDIPMNRELHHGNFTDSHQVMDDKVQNLIDLNANSESNYQDLEMKEIMFNKLKLMNSELKNDNRLLINSQESISSTLSDTLTVTCNRRKKRGRPVKKKSIRKTAERENNNADSSSKDLREVDKKLNVMKNKFSQDIVEIPGSQELFDQVENSEDHCLSENRSARGDRCDKNFESQITGLDNTCTETSKSSALVYESQELSTLKLLQESFVEKKEYSTRRRSSMGSPFMISSLFQYIIDESKRNIKEFKEFDLPVQKFGKLLRSRQEKIGDHGVEEAKALSNIYDKTVNNSEVEDVNKYMYHKQKDAHSIKDINTAINMSKEESQSCQLINMAKDEEKHSDSLKIIDKNMIPARMELNLNEFSCESQDINSQTPFQHFELPKICEGTNDDSQDELFIPKFSSSQSLFTPNPKEDRIKPLECNQKVRYDNSDSMDSQVDSTCMIETDQQTSLELPEDESLISLCTCSMKFRKKEVPVIGCLSRKSLSLWRYKKGFSPLHTWAFAENQTAEKVCSFSIDGRALFIITVRRGDNSADVYISHYSNKRDNCLFTVTNVEADIVEACHVSNRVIAVGYSKDKMIHVTKYVLHNNLKSLANSENLERTEGCLKSLYSIENLPAAVSVWSNNGEFCLWNHENKRLLLKTKLDCLNNNPKLAGVAWEEGFFFFQCFDLNGQGGKQVILNPLTMKSCVGSHFESGNWSGYRSHHTSINVIVTLDRNQNLCVWDRYSTDLLHESKQRHAICVAHVDGHVATGSDHCVHIH
ncbi:uncharacterized protein LOC127709899 isoform X2 [Mytilus californianus]|uniref:uncharacterized protein LOC127709899 isoform X2 n=1 Tax=Mytilus californianus TaxID=6549 RepID=UPI002247E575|nr:uncharacterized protein LOC127709899 isoform X2 [Mytilus californianus]